MRAALPTLLCGALLAVAMLAVAMLLPASAQALMPAGISPFLWQSPLPQGNALNDVSFVSGSTGHAVGDAGTILKTVDGGLTWRPQQSNTTAGLKSVTFIDATHGWAVGYEPDNGAGVIVSTIDGGANWIGSDLPPAIQVSRVVFTDAAHGWIAGSDSSQQRGLVYATKDGGASWTKQLETGTNKALYGISFISPRLGWAVGVSQVIYGTTDGGATWRVEHSGGSSTLRDVCFSDPAHGWAVGQGALLATSDGGASWHVQGSGFSDYRWEFNAVTFASATTGWVVGFDTGAGPVTFGTTDGGLTWQPQGGRAADALFGVACTDASHVWSVGNCGIIRDTTNGGFTWTDVSAGAYDNFEGVAFADRNHGWAVGAEIGGVSAPPERSSGGIVATIDGGLTWTPQCSVPGLTFRSVTCVDAKTAWAVGTDDLMRATTDGGATWNVQSGPPWADFYSVDFVDKQYGWAVGRHIGTIKADGVILATTDGGAHWIDESPKTPSF